MIKLTSAISPMFFIKAQTYHDTALTSSPTPSLPALHHTRAFIDLECSVLTVCTASSSIAIYGVRFFLREALTACPVRLSMFSSIPSSPFAVT